MKSIIIIYVCVALWPSIFNSWFTSVTGESLNNSTTTSPDASGDLSDEDIGLDPLTQAQIIIDEIVTNGGNILDVLKPVEFLGRGFSGITYRGELSLSNRNDTTVAMKFGLSSNIRPEFEMYSYLDAIDNPAVEKYGIPAVYYYGHWEGYDMLAITLLDLTFNQLQRNVDTDWSDIDIFIICREFVRISKYVHSRDVFHAGSIIGKIMFRGNKGFMIGFCLSARLSHVSSLDARQSDWKQFLSNVCDLRGIAADRINEVPDGELKTVLLAFANNANGPDRVNYNRMHRLITRQIRAKGVEEPALVSWLTSEQIDDVLDDLAENPIPNIQDIPNPYAPPIQHTQPNYNYFGNHWS